MSSFPLNRAPHVRCRDHDAALSGIGDAVHGQDHDATPDPCMHRIGPMRRFAGSRLRPFHAPGRPDARRGTSGFGGLRFRSSLVRALASSGSRVRVLVLPTGPAQARELLKDRKVQLAIIRNEGTIPSNVRAVAILDSDPIAIVAPKAAKIANLRELANETIGLIGPPSANADLMAAFRQHYRGKFAAVEIPPGPGHVAAALNTKQVDAVLFLAPTTRAAVVSEGWAVVRRATGKSLEFVPIDDAEAIAASFPAYEEAEIPAGQLGGAPPVLAEAVDSLQVSTYLVADEFVDAALMAALTRYLFENRQKLVADAPVASLMKAASTDKDAVIPAHAASTTYFDGEEETFMERYLDWLWIGPMVAGGVFSALIGLWRFLGFSKGSAHPDLLERGPAVIHSIRAASSLDELDAIRARIDAVVGRLSLDTVEANSKIATSMQSMVWSSISIAWYRKSA